MGSPEAIITHAIDVSAYVDTKRRSMQCHESQIAPDDFFLAMPIEGFAPAFGTEWFIAEQQRPGAGPSLRRRRVQRRHRGRTGGRRRVIGR